MNKKQIIRNMKSLGIPNDVINRILKNSEVESYGDSYYEGSGYEQEKFDKLNELSDGLLEEEIGNVDFEITSTITNFFDAALGFYIDYIEDPDSYTQEKMDKIYNDLLEKLKYFESYEGDAKELLEKPLGSWITYIISSGDNGKLEEWFDGVVFTLYEYYEKYIEV